MFPAIPCVERARALCMAALAVAVAVLVPWPGGAAATKGAAPPARPPAPKMALPSGRVQYRVSGAYSGTCTLVWSDYGRKYRQDTQVRPSTTGKAPAQARMETWAISDGDSLYLWQSLAGKRVMRVRIPKGADSGSAMPRGLGEMLGPFGSAAKTGTPSGSARVLGKPCEVRTQGPAKVWLWKGLLLRMEMEGSPEGRATKIEAVKLDTAPKLSPATFRVPPGFTVEDVKTGLPRRPAGPPKR